MFKQIKNLSTFIVIQCLFVVAACSNEADMPIANSEATEISNNHKISLEDAKKELVTLLQDIDSHNSRQEAREIGNAYTLSNRPDSKSSELYQIHIFNFVDNKGFAIMSGDDRIPSLVALTDNGSLNEGEIISNHGFNLFLTFFDELYIAKTGDGGEKTLKETHMYGDWENIVYKQYGNCPVMWGQDTPYNKYCPHKDGKRTLTGCVATAVAQLMACHKHPNEFNFYTFNWDEMTYELHPHEYSAANQVAYLMQQLGTSDNLDMDYGVNGSYAYSNNVKRTLENFGYTEPGIYEDYNTSKVVSELKNNYSVLISGASYKTKKKFLFINLGTSYSGGHQWLAHGLLERRREVSVYSNGIFKRSYYQSEYYILCNWGWDGYQDGYYLNMVFDANENPIFYRGESSSRSENEVGEGNANNYQYKIKAITGIRK